MSAHKKDHNHLYALIEEKDGVRKFSLFKHDRFPKRVKREMDGLIGYTFRIVKINNKI